MYAVVQIGSMIFRSESMTTRSVVSACACGAAPATQGRNSTTDTISRRCRDIMRDLLARKPVAAQRGARLVHDQLREREHAGGGDADQRKQSRHLVMATPPEDDAADDGHRQEHVPQRENTDRAHPALERHRTTVADE